MAHTARGGRVYGVQAGEGIAKPADGGGTMTMTDEETLALLVRLDERTERMEEDVGKLKHVLLEGNGSPALTVQVARIDERVTAVEDNKKEASLSKRAWLGLVAACVGGGGLVTVILEKIL